MEEKEKEKQEIVTRRSCPTRSSQHHQTNALSHLALPHCLRVPQHVLPARKEDFTLPKCQDREPEQDEPRPAHEHRHDDVHHVEAGDIQRVAEHAQSRYPPDCIGVYGQFPKLFKKRGLIGESLRSDVGTYHLGRSTPSLDRVLVQYL